MIFTCAGVTPEEGEIEIPDQQGLCVSVDQEERDSAAAADTVLKKHIRPLLVEMGVEKRIGWHSFRHGLGTMLRQVKVDLKVAQEMLRHANPAITMGLYQQAVTEEKREAQNLAMKAFLGPDYAIEPKRTRLQ